MSSQMQGRGSLCALAFQAKKSALDNGMRVLKPRWLVSTKKKKKKPFKVLINFGSLLQCEYVSVKRLLLATPLSGRSLHAIWNVSVLDWMWLVEFLQNDLRSDHLAQARGAAARDNSSWRAAGVTVRSWGRRSNGWGRGGIVSDCWSRRRQKAKKDRGERVNNAVCRGKNGRIGECGIVTECLHADLSFPVGRESLCDV